jgi:DNA polymerase III delta subunit
MLYVYHGTNTTKIANQATTLVASLKKRRPDAEVFSFEGETLRGADLEALVAAQGLFVQRSIVVIRESFAVEASREVVLPQLERLAASENIFIVVEGKLAAAHKRSLEKHAEKVEEHTTATKEQAFNVFALAGHLGERSRQKLWIGYQEALRAGIEPESIYGTLMWTLRGMLAASRTESAAEAGMKDYPYRSAKGNARNYTPEELTTLSRNLLRVYHEARRGAFEFRVGLERWLLSI